MDTIHPFEKSGCGRAPFRFIGYECRVGPIKYTDPETGIQMECGAPGQPMGTCDHCGTGIMHCCIIQDADGKRFIVGTSCVAKTKDVGTKIQSDAKKAQTAFKAARKRELDLETRNWVLRQVRANEALRTLLESRPHSKGFIDRHTGEPLTELGELEWMSRSCGAVKLAIMRKDLEALMAQNGIVPV